MASNEAWKKKWLNFTEQNARRYALYASLSGLFFSVISGSKFGAFLEHQISRPLEYQTRHRLKRDPRVDDRLAIYGLGDSAIAYLKSEDLEIGEWSGVLQNFAKRGASSVLVNRIFALPKGPGIEQLQKLQGSRTRFVVGSFLAAEPISGRTPLSTDRVEFDPKHYAANEVPSFCSLQSGTLYGPDPQIAEVSQVGHLMYNGNFSLQAFIRMQGDKVLPLAPLLAFKDVQFDEEQLLVNGEHVPLFGSELLVNLPNPNAFYERTYNLSGPVKRWRSGEKEDAFADGTHVVVLPALYTGNADMVESPFGTIPGGFLSAAVINSVLTGQWLRRMPAGHLFVFALCIPAFFTATLLTGVRFWLSYLAINFSLVLLGLGLFSYASVVVPWFPAMCCFSLTGASLFALTSRDLAKTLRLTQDFLRDLSRAKSCRHCSPSAGSPWTPQKPKSQRFSSTSWGSPSPPNSFPQNKLLPIYAMRFRQSSE
ncbi:MAG: hypothetical protein R3B54_03785 [Bdellovibrionota bacterium]